MSLITYLRADTASRVLFLLGVLSIASSLVSSPFFLSYFAPDGNIDNAFIKAASFSLCLLFLIFGVLFFVALLEVRVARYAQNLLVILITLAGALFFALMILEWSVLTPNDIAGSPSSTHEYQTLENGLVTYSLNSSGFRGPIYEVDSANESRRFAVIGDSFVFGAMVNDDQTIPMILDDLTESMDFYNFGISSTGPGYYLRAARKLSVDNGMGLLIMYYVDNDFIPSRHGIADKMASSNVARLFEVIKDRYFSKQFDVSCGEEISNEVCAAFNEQSLNPFLLSRSGVGDNHDYYEKLSRFIASADGPVYKHFESLAKLSNTREIELKIVFIPSKYQVDDFYAIEAANRLGFEFNPISKVDSRPQRALLGICGRLQLDCLDLLPIIRGRDAYFPLDDHFTEKGNAMAAKAIAKEFFPDYYGSLPH